METIFAAATQDELWLLRGGTATLSERRVSRGTSRSVGDVRGGAGIKGAMPRIEATDRLDDGELVRLASTESERAIAALRDTSATARVRTIADVRRVAGLLRVTTSLSITVPYAGGLLSVVTTPSRALDELARLTDLASRTPEGEADPRALPILWRNGTAAVLFHEAIGHPAEHGHAPLRWPAWLRVRDDPAFDAFAVMRHDDAGEPVAAALLSDGEAPRAWRRESFRDVPLPRMTNLVVACEGAPLALPAERIEVRLVAGGAYEPLTGRVTLQVSVAELVTPAGRLRLAPFTLVEPREAIAARVVGGGGPVECYPGVVCSSEGQELVVGSAAPDILTSGLAA